MGGTSFFGVTVHNRLSQAWGKSANCLRSARVKQKKHLFLGVVFVPGLRATRANSLPSQWVQPALFSAIAAEREGEHCKGRQLLQNDCQVKGTDSQGVLFRRDSLKTAMSLGTSDRLKLHPCSALYPLLPSITLLMHSPSFVWITLKLSGFPAPKFLSLNSLPLRTIRELESRVYG